MQCIEYLFSSLVEYTIKIGDIILCLVLCKINSVQMLPTNRRGSESIDKRWRQRVIGSRLWQQSSSTAGDYQQVTTLFIFLLTKHQKLQRSCIQNLPKSGIPNTLKMNQKGYSKYIKNLRCIYFSSDQTPKFSKVLYLFYITLRIILLTKQHLNYSL